MSSTEQGTPGDDVINVDETVTTIDAGKGNDTIHAGGNADTYKYSKGDGHDVIYDNESGAVTADHTLDAIRFSSDIAYNDLQFAIDGNDLLITFKNSPDDSIRIIDAATNPEHAVEKILIENRYNASQVSTYYVENGLFTHTLTNDDDSFDGSAYTTRLDVVGLDGADIITTSNRSDVIHAGAGNDTITATGNDTVYAGDGDDTITGDASNLYAGAGNDTITIDNTSTSINGEDGDDTITTTGSAYQHVQGGNGNDTIRTGSANDAIIGGADNDTIWAGEGDNSIWGGTGEDEIHSGSGNDTIDAGDDNDTIWAGDGTNTIDAGKGNDIIHAGANADTYKYSKGDGHDVIYDNESGAVTA
ncbi:calcium-binding protein, partial [Halodesulfovibrio spirochaetisodalis]|uniref:calcium-binding protein n=1 Tax=Halodesulfovibrio spirochaetisodalis TaxID=1560234 RepID=UPI0022B230C7